MSLEALLTTHGRRTIDDGRLSTDIQRQKQLALSLRKKATCSCIYMYMHINIAKHQVFIDKFAWVYMQGSIWKKNWCSWMHWHFNFSYCFRLNSIEHGADSSCLNGDELWHEISNNVVCATSKGSDQPAHTRSLIRAFASRLNILWVLSYWQNST